MTDMPPVNLPGFGGRRSVIVVCPECGLEFPEDKDWEGECPQCDTRLTAKKNKK